MNTIIKKFFNVYKIIDLAFAVLFYPCVLIHELSHYVIARLLKIKVSRLNLLDLTWKYGAAAYIEIVPSDNRLKMIMIAFAPAILLWPSAFVMWLIGFSECLPTCIVFCFWGAAGLPSVNDVKLAFS
jgi:Zn-dependent protease